MFPRPSIDDVIEYGKALGLSLTAAEARSMQSRMLEHIAILEEFHELRIEEHHLPLEYTDRDPGYRPTEQEDPLNVFIRKCWVPGAEQGPLTGKTIGLKDHISVAGVPLTLGSHFMDGYIPDFDATITTRLLAAGGTIVGKMNMEDFSFGGPGLSGIGDFGRPLNPHNPAHVTGGSSSGSAAAVAAGLVDISFGGDQGGSIRLPAAWSGTVGLMATHGLIPHTGVFGLDPSVDYVGPLTRTVEDLAVVLECVAGLDGYDPRQMHLPAQLPRYTDALTRGTKDIKIGILSEGFGFPGSEPEVEQTVREALATLEQAGAQLTQASVPLHEKAMLALLPIFFEGGKHNFDTNLGGAFAKTYYPSSFLSTFGRFKKSHGHELPLNYKLNLMVGDYLTRFTHGRLYAKAQNVRPTFVKQYNEAFSQVDVLAMPTLPMKAPVYREPQDYEKAIEHTLFGGQFGMDLGLVVRNTAPFNLTGHPAISIPCGKVDGLPIGLMLVAPYFREDLLIQVAAAYQHRVDWDSFFPSS
jgi:amidase